MWRFFMSSVLNAWIGISLCRQTNVLKPSPLSPNTAYRLSRESITHKGFGKFTQEGISFDEGVTNSNYLPPPRLPFLFISEKYFAFFDPVVANAPSLEHFKQPSFIKVLFPLSKYMFLN